MRLDRLLTLCMFLPLQRRLGRKGGLCIPILMYHSVAANDEPGRHPYYRTNTRPDVFARHMQYLADNNYRVISLSTAVSLLSSDYPDDPSPVTGHRSPAAEAPRVAVLTFDDGYADFHDTAWPILKKHGFTATMFLPTGFIGDERNALSGRDCLTWDEVKMLAAEGAAFGAHTVSHVQLYELYKTATPNSSFPRKRESMAQHTTIEHELRASRQTIEEKLGKPVDHYSYAYAFPEQDPEFVAAYESSLRAAGYGAAVSTRIGTARRGDNPYTLKRIPVNTCDDEALFRAKLEGGYDWLHAVQAAKKMMHFAG